MYKYKTHLLLTILLTILLLPSCGLFAPEIQFPDRGEDFFTFGDEIVLGMQIDAAFENSMEFMIWDESSSQGAANVYGKLYEILDDITTLPDIELADTLDYQINIILDDNTTNAFMLPGGYFYITTGMLKEIRHTEEFVGILTHSMAYSEKGYAINKLQDEFGNSFLLDVIDKAAIDQEAPEAIEIGKFLYESPYQHSIVKMADEFGMGLYCRFSYNKEYFREFIQEVEVDWLFTHPSNMERILAIEDLEDACAEITTRPFFWDQKILPNLP